MSKCGKIWEGKGEIYVIICGICQGDVDEEEIFKRWNPTQKLHKNKACKIIAYKQYFSQFHEFLLLSY